MPEKMVQIRHNKSKKDSTPATVSQRAFNLFYKAKGWEIVERDKEKRTTTPAVTTTPDPAVTTTPEE